MNTYTAVAPGAARKRGPVLVGHMEESAKVRIRAFLDRLDWGATHLFDTAPQYAELRDRKLDLFSEEERLVDYTDGISVHSLKELFRMLFDSSNRSRRIAAFNFLAPVRVG